MYLYLPLYEGRNQSLRTSSINFKSRKWKCKSLELGELIHRYLKPLKPIRYALCQEIQSKLMYEFEPRKEVMLLHYLKSLVNVQLYSRVSKKQNGHDSELIPVQVC